MEKNRREAYSGREFDEVFKHVKSFGRYQMILYGLINLMAFPLTTQFSGLVFAVGTPAFHCVTPNVTCPKTQCCDGCTSYEFDGPFTSTVSEWNMICDRAYLAATVQSLMFVGMLIGSFLSGMMSDAWGRKKCMFLCTGIMVSNLFPRDRVLIGPAAEELSSPTPLVMTTLALGTRLMVVSGVGSAFVDCVSLFAVLRFILGFGLIGTVLPLYIYTLELVGPHHRTAAGNVLYFYYNGLAMVAPLWSYFVPSWRAYILFSTAPAALLFVFWKWIPESPRWLVAHDRLDEAVTAIKKYGAKDGGEVDVELLRNLLQEVREEQIRVHEENKKYTPVDLVRTPKMRKWSLIMYYQRFTVALVTFGILLFFSKLSGNIYINYVIIKGATTLRVPFTWLIFLKFGRRVPHGIIVFTAGLLLLLILAVYKDVPTATTAFALLGFILTDINWTGVYLITAELFPTTLRNTAQGTGSTFARIGGILSPYVAMMGQLPGLSIAFPSAIFGLTALVAGIMMYWLPETLYSPMHQTIQQAESAPEDYGIPCCGTRLGRAARHKDESAEQEEMITKQI